MSGFFKLNWQDLLKGVITSVLTAVVAFLYAFISNGGDISAVGFQQLGGVALAALLGYILKQLGTSETGAFLGIGKK